MLEHFHKLLQQQQQKKKKRKDFFITKSHSVYFTLSLLQQTSYLSFFILHFIILKQYIFYLQSYTTKRRENS